MVGWECPMTTIGCAAPTRIEALYRVVWCPPPLDTTRFSNRQKAGTQTQLGVTL